MRKETIIVLYYFYFSYKSSCSPYWYHSSLCTASYTSGYYDIIHGKQRYQFFIYSIFLPILKRQLPSITMYFNTRPTIKRSANLAIISGVGSVPSFICSFDYFLPKGEHITKLLFRFFFNRWYLMGGMTANLCLISIYIYTY